MLNPAWIDRLFAEFSMMYGQRFFDQWKNVPMDDLKANWATKLSGFASMPQAIAGALKALEDRAFPPTQPEFLALCREAARRIGPSVPALTYKPDPERLREFSANLSAIIERGTRGSDPIFWATHPKSDIALRYILAAAHDDPTKFQPCVDSLIADGRITREGVLLEKYVCLGQWETVRKARHG